MTADDFQALAVSLRGFLKKGSAADDFQALAEWLRGSTKKGSARDVQR